MKIAYYFIDDSGNNPVKDFIDSLSIKEQVKVFAYINELKKQGNNLRRPMADYLEDGIYELRPKDDRIFYFFYLKDNVVLVHAIKKHTDKVPPGDLKLSKGRKRMVEITTKRIVCGNKHLKKCD